MQQSYNLPRFEWFASNTNTFFLPYSAVLCVQKDKKRKCVCTHKIPLFGDEKSEHNKKTRGPLWTLIVHLIYDVITWNETNIFQNMRIFSLITCCFFSFKVNITDLLLYYDIVRSQQAHDVEMTLYRRRCDVITSHRRQYDIISTLCARWVVTEGRALINVVIPCVTLSL